MKGYRCPLGAIQPSRIDAEKIKREAWHEQGFLVVNIDDTRLDWVEKQLVKNLGDRLYGKRSNSNG